MKQQPGQPPYRRGIHEDMYRGRPWTIRQLSGAGSPEQVNRRIRFLLDEGATGVSLLFDVPTIQMYDSDEPESAGMVGVVGVPIDTVEDMEATFKDIPIDNVSVSLVTHYPSNTLILMSMYLAMATRRGIHWEKLRGSVQNDFIMEEVVRSGPAFIPPRACFDLQVANAAFLAARVPHFNVATLNGYNLREYGADISLETAVALANGAEMAAAWPGLLERTAFFFCIGNNFLREVARLRAAREVWCEMTGAKLRVHCQTSGLSLTREEPLNNIVRAGYQALAAVFGGCQSLHVDSYDEAYSVPSQETSLVALRTQQVIQVETGVMDYADPLGGAPVVEALTDEIKTHIKEDLDWIDRNGGIVALVESGILSRQCQAGQALHNPRRVPARPNGQLYSEPLFPIKKAVVRPPNAPKRLGPDTMPMCVLAAMDGATVGQLRRALLATYGEWRRP